MTITELARQASDAAVSMACIDENTKNSALSFICEALSVNKEEIFAANKSDLDCAEKDKLPLPIFKRLAYNENKLQQSVDGINQLINLPDPVNKQLDKTYLSDDLVLTKVSCPIGVIGVIFESRPDALIQIATLCIKSGNVAILKGGSEAKNTNKALAQIIDKAGQKAGLPQGFITLLETREDISDLLKCEEYVNLIIPRGSNAFVKYIMDNTRIPVMGHADGICHLYVDKDCDIEKSVVVAVDAKTQYPSVCNAIETLLVHEAVAKEFLPKVSIALKEKGVKLLGCEKTCEIILCEKATEVDWATEYLDYILSIKVVGSVEEAVRHINKYGSGHTDSIMTENSATAKYFMMRVDSAGVYQNCSTRFADGYRYGFGAEVGISTSKLHARGPVGLDGLMSYKYLLVGNGDIVADYEKGIKKYTYKKEM